MAKSKPSKKKEYYEWIKFLVLWMVAKMVAKGFDMAFIQDQLKPDFDEYERCYLLCEDPTTDTTQNRAALKNAKKKLDKSASRAVEMIKSNSLVTDTEMDTLKIAHGTGGGNQPTPPPRTYPVFTVKKEKATVPGRLVLMYKDLGQKLEGRPPHVSHMEYKILISDTIVDKVALLKEGGIDTASPIEFDRPEDRGKYLSIAGRWISNGGKPGGWGPVDGFIIP